MKKQIVVIGLGQFGMGLVKTLATRDVEVIAVDTDEKRIHQAAALVDKVYCFDATEEDAVAQLMPASRDVCICATGDQSKEAAIICTALLKQMGAKRVIARANDELHSRILKLVGADEVINPEWEFGARFANRIISESILEQMSLGADLVVTELKVPARFANQSLVDLNLRKQFGVTVIALRNENGGIVRPASPNEILQESDILILVSQRGSVEKMIEA
ncbi:MAG: potassium channel family protein [Oligoflexus sp.]